MNLTLFSGSTFPAPGGWRRKPSPRSARRGRSSIVLALPALTLLAGHQLLLTRPFIDDSYIFYRYAANWAAGLGPVFNRGEHVEGFSSFLWTALLTVAAWLGWAPHDAAPAVGLLLAGLCLVVVVLVARRVMPEHPGLVVLVAAALAVSPPFAMYATSGMDTTLFALLLLSAVAACARHVQIVRDGADSSGWMITAVALLVALVLARAEGPIYALVISVAAAFLGRPGDMPSNGWLTHLVPPIAAGLATAVVLVVRQLVFGSWVSATVMAKNYTGHLAGEALRHPAKAGPLWHALSWGERYVGLAAFLMPVVVLAAVIVYRRRSGRTDPFAALGLLALAAAVLTAVWSGGDWMPFRRLLVPVLPLMTVLAGWAAAVLCEPLPGRWRAHRGTVRLLLAVAGCALAVLAAGIWAGRGSPTAETRRLRGIGRVLASTPGRVRLLTNLAGLLPYTAGPRTYVWDMLGLTSQHNARYGQIFSPEFGRTDPAYDFSRRFDVFVSNSSWDFALLLDLLPERREPWLLLTSPQLRRIPLYVVVSAASPPVDALRRDCGCESVSLRPAARRRMLRALLARGMAPSGLLAAERSHAPFPS